MGSGSDWPRPSSPPSDPGHRCLKMAPPGGPASPRALGCLQGPRNGSDDSPAPSTAAPPPPSHGHWACGARGWHSPTSCAKMPRPSAAGSHPAGEQQAWASDRARGTGRSPGPGLQRLWSLLHRVPELLLPYVTVRDRPPKGQAWEDRCQPKKTPGPAARPPRTEENTPGIPARARPARPSGSGLPSPLIPHPGD